MRANHTLLLAGFTEVVEAVVLTDDSPFDLEKLLHYKSDRFLLLKCQTMQHQNLKPKPIN